MVNAIITEIRLTRNFFDNEPLKSIYFGGGTPSLIENASVAKILTEIQKYHSVDKNAEITLEANPDDLTPEKLRNYRNIGINRLSIGIQSFFDDDLKALNRVHDARQSRQSIEWAEKAGFSNYSVDLIYGLPGSSANRWMQNIEQALSYRVPHISAYALTVEPQTALDAMVRKGTVKMVDEDEYLAQFDHLIIATKTAGYTHYEISNFCRDQMFAKHNTSYWTGEKYLGLGPSAHSYDGQHRRWNVAHIKKYFQSLQNEKLPFEQETLTLNQQFNEFLMLRLRTQWGVDLREVSVRFGKDYLKHLYQTINKYVDSNHLVVNNQVLQLTHSGKFISDQIIADLFVA